MNEDDLYNIVKQEWYTSLGCTAANVYATIRGLSKKNGYCDATVAYISYRSGVKSKTTVRNHIRMLERIGRIRVEHPEKNGVDTCRIFVKEPLSKNNTVHAPEPINNNPSHNNTDSKSDIKEENKADDARTIFLKIWIDFYRKKKGTDAVMNNMEKLDDMWTIIQSKIKEQGKDASNCETVSKWVNDFFNYAWELSDDWLRDNWCETVICKKFNQIYAKIINNGKYKKGTEVGQRPSDASQFVDKW